MSKTKDNQVLENFVLMFLHCLYTISRVCWVGLKSFTFEMGCVVVAVAILLFMLMFGSTNHLYRFIDWLYYDEYYPLFVRLFFEMQVLDQYLFLMGGVTPNSLLGTDTNGKISQVENHA